MQTEKVISAESLMSQEEQWNFENRTAPNRSLLSKDAIRYHRAKGDIFISPYDERDLKTTSVDVRLGYYFYKEQVNKDATAIFNPFDQAQVLEHWGKPQEATLASEWSKRTRTKLVGIPDDAYIIVLRPGETTLNHTIQFIGGCRGKDGRSVITTEMRARSSVGRIGITICKCAGWGDVGYCNRWTMEVTNHMRDANIVLVVGMRIAQIAFMKVDQVHDLTYAKDGGSKYQATDDLEEMVKTWHPRMMLPALYKDYELTTGFPIDPIRVNLEEK